VYFLFVLFLFNSAVSTYVERTTIAKKDSHPQQKPSLQTAKKGLLGDKGSVPALLRRTTSQGDDVIPLQGGRRTKLFYRCHGVRVGFWCRMFSYTAVPSRDRLKKKKRGADRRRRCVGTTLSISTPALNDTERVGGGKRIIKCDDMR
jgi:hypothetical protein